MTFHAVRRGWWLAVLPVLYCASPASAEVLNPVFQASIEDQNYDGSGDKFNNSPFEGLLRHIDTQTLGQVEDRAVAEFDLGGYAGRTIDAATLDFAIGVNNAGGDQTRPFDVYLYSGNGTADLTDFSATGTVVGQVTLDVSQGYVTGNIDVTSSLQSLLDNGVRYVGLRLNALGSENFPSLLAQPTLTVTAVPEPTSFALVGLGLGLGFAIRRRRV